ncbi:MAG: hypothetical protein GF418_07990, partial [Chitinivibrionales bacterium]|nr:hypothetical protein [Chitinivibrionales bacterium]MBD3395553.1 hypothetical protein [Chitinivibrionales bacterium]
MHRHWICSIRSYSPEKCRRLVFCSIALGELYQEKHMTTDRLRKQPSGAVSVRDFGANGDGISDDWNALQQALDSGTEAVWIPEGSYKVGSTLRVPSNRKLYAHENARVFLADGAGADQSCFVIANADPVAGDANILIQGGIWDGNNAGNPRGEDHPFAYTGGLMDFSNVKGLTLRALTLQDPEAYYIRIGETRGFVVEHLSFRATRVRPNQDGVHLGGFCEDGIIRHLDARGDRVTGDDLVALNADDNNTRAQNLGLKCGPIRRITIEDISAESCHSFVRFLSVWSPIEEISLSKVRGGCRYCAVNMDAYRGCLKPLASDPARLYPHGVGHIENVTCRDLRVYKGD